MGCFTAPSGTVRRWARVVSEGASKATGWSHLVTLGVWAHFPLRKLLSLGNSL